MLIFSGCIAAGRPSKIVIRASNSLVDEMLELIHKYDETLYMATVIGCVELVRQQLIIDAIGEDDE